MPSTTQAGAIRKLLLDLHRSTPIRVKAFDQNGLELPVTRIGLIVGADPVIEIGVRRPVAETSGFSTHRRRG